MILISHDVSRSDHVTTTDPEPNKGLYDDMQPHISKAMTNLVQREVVTNGTKHKPDKILPTA
ncbi:hypothetical protein BTUL_0024g00340 [Botrytis tulipae]|uniref:Uncharacterized protein n=1 Tax=Botrytis tulipae TaxID=87230 RepID=A0A4Z1EWG8_9HELO|nr:hypothetical protein BTUL_0024g00340 [Botrytis tulipae]